MYSTSRDHHDVNSRGTSNMSLVMTTNFYKSNSLVVDGRRRKNCGAGGTLHRDKASWPRMRVSRDLGRERREGSVV
jgi:hypothetical protein